MKAPRALNLPLVGGDLVLWFYPCQVPNVHPSLRIGLRIDLSVDTVQNRRSAMR